MPNFKKNPNAMKSSGFKMKGPTLYGKKSPMNKKGGMKPTGGMKGYSAEEGAKKRAKFKSNVSTFGKGLGKSVKQLGTQISSGGKKVISNVKKGDPLTKGTFAGKDGGKIKAAANKKFNTPKTNPKSKANTGGNDNKKVEVKKADYTKSKSVNALVSERTKWRKDNPGKKFPGQSEINKRLKANPKKWD